MKRLSLFCYTFLFIIQPFINRAQIEDPERNLKAIIESIVETLNEDTDATAVIEDLQKLAENPLNINTANESDLSKLLILNDIQIQKIIEHREKYGPFLSIYEMNTIEGFNPELLQKMEPFIRFGEQNPKLPNLGESLKFNNQELLFRTLFVTQKQDGYEERDNGTKPFEGNPFRYYSRYRFHSEFVSAGITAEKDPGETFFSGSNKSGFDYYSGHISFYINKTIENVILGDYYISSGQGLVLGQGFSLGKSVNTQMIAKNNRGIKPYSSTDENFFFRGAAVALKFGISRLNLFLSSKKNDANLAWNDAGDNFFTSLQTSGYHRTASEIEDERVVKNLTLGANYVVHLKNLKLGATAVYQNFDRPWIRSDQLYNRFRFEGKMNANAGIDCMYVLGNYQLFGEAAISKSTGLAVLQGVIARLNDRISFTTVIRNYDKKYNALWANSFGESSAANNEKGLYFGTKILVAKGLAISAYSDFYKSEWLNFSTAGPSQGWDFLAQADYRISRKASVYLRYKNEEKDQKTTDGTLLFNQPEITRRTRFHFQYKPSESIVLKTRFEHCFFKANSPENGFIAFQDIQFIPSKIPANISVRLAWFNTKSYNSRIYAYENDLLYTFSIPAFFGNGLRSYLNLKYNMSDRLEIWFKLANTYYPNQETISSGYTEITGNKKTEVKFQVRIKI